MKARLLRWDAGLLRDGVASLRCFGVFIRGYVVSGSDGHRPSAAALALAASFAPVVAYAPAVFLQFPQAMGQVQAMTTEDARMAEQKWIIESLPSPSGHFYDVWMSAAPATVEWSNQQDCTDWALEGRIFGLDCSSGPDQCVLTIWEDGRIIDSGPHEDFCSAVTGR